MSSAVVQRAELFALVDDLLHAVLGAPENELQAPFDEGCRALADLPLSAEDRLWIEGELQRIGEHFDLR